MAKGENIFKRKDGRWEARYIKGYELSGKIKYGFCYGKTYKEAKEKVIRAKAELLTGAPKETAFIKKRFSCFCDEWFEAKKGSVKESTCVKYSTILEKHIKPGLGECLPYMINDTLIEDFANKLSIEDHLASKTVKDALVVLRSILQFTAKRYPGTLHQIEIKFPKEARKEIRVLSREEQDRFTKFLLKDMDPCKFGILLALFTGIRIGEICALRWENISLEEGVIHISSTMQRLKNTQGASSPKTRVVMGSPKSGTSLRTIPMGSEVAKLCGRIAPNDSSAFVLTGNAKYMEPRALQYRFGNYAKACGLDGVHFHTLRHTFATRCIEVGFELKSLSEILGHANTTITLERYIHSSMDLKRSNMNKLEAVGF